MNRIVLGLSSNIAALTASALTIHAHPVMGMGLLAGAIGLAWSIKLPAIPKTSVDS